MQVFQLAGVSAFVLGISVQEKGRSHDLKKEEGLAGALVLTALFSNSFAARISLGEIVSVQMKQEDTQDPALPGFVPVFKALI